MKLSAIPLDQAAPGMRLGEDVRDAQGAVLLAAGGELSESLLEALRRRGIQEVCVAQEETLSEAEREARREVVRARLSHLFRGAGADGADRQLFETVLGYRLGQLE